MPVIVALVIAFAVAMLFVSVILPILKTLIELARQHPIGCLFVIAFIAVIFLCTLIGGD